MSTNGVIQELLNMGSLNDDLHNEVYTGLIDLRKKISGSFKFFTIVLHFNFIFLLFF